MDRFKLIGHPIVVFALICAFVFVYFVYLKGGNPLSSMIPSAKPPETETELNGQPPRELNAETLAEPEGRLPGQLSQPNQMPGQANQLDNQFDNRPVNPGAVAAALPNQNSPLQPIAVPDKTLMEGHWIGCEVIPITPGIAKANSIPPDLAGVLIDEVTLLSAEAGLLAGDVVTAVNDRQVVDLKSFWQATKEVGQASRASLSIYRGGKSRTVVIISTEALGMAQMEAAPMILATDKSPHGYYGPCDKCHSISKAQLNTGQLAKDQGDVLTKVAPAIRKGTPAPHRRRGTCTLCHVVL